ncbi:MAG: glycosyltransferase [Desulfuromonadaceae bacterium]|nr:glycosyltransferase [Desulfuromonadaceae bacterium]MDD5104175.1 glycosyltransferase [Desulfuromonadaceae bacterium]
MIPTVSVIISSYASEAFIAECLSDLVAQTIADQLEIVVVDASSPQNERAVVEQYQKLHPNISYIRAETRIGIYAAWNLAIQCSSAPYIITFSTNDRLASNACELLKTALDEHPDVMLVYGNTWLTLTPHQTFEAHIQCGAFDWPDYSFDFILNNCCVGPHPMWRRIVHGTIGYFDETFIAIGDQDMWLRIAERYQMHHIPEYTGLYWYSEDGIGNKRDIADPEIERIRGHYLCRHDQRLQRIAQISQMKQV